MKEEELLVRAISNAINLLLGFIFTIMGFLIYFEVIEVPDIKIIAVIAFIAFASSFFANVKESN